MRILTQKIVVTISALIITSIIGVQFYLVRGIYRSEAFQFHTQVVKSFHYLFNKKLVVIPNGKLSDPISQLSPNSYLVQIDSVANPEKAKDALINEFSNYQLNCGFNIHFEFEGSSKELRFYKVDFSDAHVKTEELPTTEIRSLNQPGSYLYLEFPSRNSFLFRRIGPWLLSCIFLVLSLAALAILLYHYYKHRFWNNVQKEFVNNFLHEVRTPISVISIAGKVLQSEGIEKHPSRFRKYSRIIKDQTDHLQLRVNQITELAISGKKTTIFEKRIVDVNTLVASAISFVEPLVQEKRASIEFIRSAEPLQLYADSTYLTQAIINILDNSLKYANLPEIRLETATSEKVCAISIKDNGIGMDKKYFKHIFRKYYRIPTGNVHNVKGFGIGLNFVKNVIDAHDGRIEVSSVTGKGTEFTIILPLT